MLACLKRLFTSVPPAPEPPQDWKPLINRRVLVVEAGVGLIQVTAREVAPETGYVNLNVDGLGWRWCHPNMWKIVEVLD